jgi:dTMP kinase
MKKDGFFVSVEGIDGSGKSTVVQHLINRWFPEAVITRQPVPGIRAFFMQPGISAECEALLAAASLQFALDVRIEPALKRGDVVISDRFSDSMIAYQGHGRGLDIDWLEDLLPRRLPDFTILLDLSPEKAFNRIKYRALDRIEMEDLDFHRNVRAGFLDLAEYQYDRIVVINAERQLEDVLRDVDEKIREVYHGEKV